MGSVSFQKLHVLLVGGSPGNMALLRGLLASLGIEDIAISENSTSARLALAADDYQAVFCDETMGPTNAVAFAISLRRKVGAKNRRVPIILILERPQAQLVELARDAGIDGVILRPFSQVAVKRKLMSVLLNPKTFVNAGRYTGPDRRHKSRRASSGPDKTGKDRRKRGRRRSDQAAT